GQQVAGVVTVPASFPQFNAVLMRIIMTCVVLGVSVNVKKLKDHLDYTFANTFLYGAQLVVGILIALACASSWPGMPAGWGALGTFAYFGSHGGAAAAGSVLEELGSEGAVGIGMILATGGLIASMTVGMLVVNYGVKKGWATFVKEPKAQPEHFYHGLLPKDQRESIGSMTTTPVSINPLAFHLAIIMLAYAIGYGLFQAIIVYVPVLAKVNAMLYGLVGGLILWPVMCKLKLDGYVDRKILNQICGFSLEVLIVTSMATLQLDLVSKYAVPLALHIVISCALTIAFCVWYFKEIGNEQWFEKCVMVVGTCTGSSPNGLALVRAIDPNSESCAPEAHGVYNALFWWNNLLTPVIPAMFISSMWGTVGLGLVFAVVSMFLAFAVFRKKAR
ncbi:MAG: sodium/glutamate symporter, partial [Pyramidobacter sp.]|nr:sodium/glutamate symporter [Pyramidobacter sp.]